QGRTKPKLMVRDIIYRDDTKESAGKSEATNIADSLFERAEQILSRDAYAGIGEASRFVTKVVGVTFEGRQAVVSALAAGDELVVVRDVDNPKDVNAIALRTLSGAQVGFLRRQIARELAPRIDGGVRYFAHVSAVTGGTEGRSYGANIEVSCEQEGEADSARLAEASGERARLATLDGATLDDELRRAMIGSHSLLPAQRTALDNLAAGRSTLCVMATGRGKSLIFHMHAAHEAIARGKASIFVYPLRALVADQSFHLEEAFSRMGMHVRVLTGETPLDERTATFGAVARGDVDVLLTTPEFLAIHVQRFAETGRVGFVVVDEAHHAGLSAGGNRSAYGSLPEVLDALGRPTALAVTATAATPVAEEICRLMGIDHADVVLDRSVRENLGVRDCRELRDRDAALMSIVASGDKCVVYVNSRDQSVSIARMLRKSIPDLGRRIAFYNAGLNRSERAAVEEAFRTGELTCIVSTSAFGEGVNLPDIRNVVLYHMPFGQVEFNQMSGRAGRDGANSVVHLLFGSRDARINERIISSSAPDRNALIALYRALRSLAQGAVEAGEQDFSCPNAEIAERATALAPHSGLDERSVSCGVSVFRELGFLTTTGYGTARRIHMVASPERMELERSIRYLEGMRTRDEFLSFREWALDATPDEMLARINQPITPSFGRHVGDGR
ncbi:MAG: DEAD/DEAH box helicase, partial [Atopobiaceae bacterium]|nr:DEAD/DEAH box helicase [Atopobiaceae bacterium]